MHEHISFVFVCMCVCLFVVYKYFVYMWHYYVYVLSVSVCMSLCLKYWKIQIHTHTYNTYTYWHMHLGVYICTHAHLVCVCVVPPHTCTYTCTCRLTEECLGLRTWIEHKLTSAVPWLPPPCLTCLFPKVYMPFTSVLSQFTTTNFIALAAATSVAPIIWSAVCYRSNSKWTDCLSCCCSTGLAALCICHKAC